jgi:hypothetical protein
MSQGVVVREWRCKCGKLLGVFRHKRIYLRFGGRHQYIVSCPATTVCRGCGTLNEVVEEGDPSPS